MTESSILPNRGVLRLSGEDRVRFLQGLVSNDVTAMTPGRAVYACLLTAQGKFLHDFFLIADGETLLIDCEASRRDDLIRRLKMFRLRSKIEIADETDAFAIYAVDGDGAAVGGIVYDDPRLALLGRRALLPKGEAAPANAEPFAAWDRRRILAGAPDGSRDMEVEKSILLENNIDVLNGIAWDKGCYMGQELTARTRYRGLIKKRLVPVEIAGEAPAPGTILSADGREIGEMRSNAGPQIGNNIGLALLRLEAIRAAQPLAVGSATLTPRIPPHLTMVLAEPAEA